MADTTPRSLGRRKASGTPKEEETDRMLGLLRLKGQVERMFHGNSVRAARWMTSPSRALGGNTPLAAAATQHGAARVTETQAEALRKLVLRFCGRLTTAATRARQLLSVRS